MIMISGTLVDTSSCCFFYYYFCEIFIFGDVRGRGGGGGEGLKIAQNVK